MLEEALLTPHSQTLSSTGPRDAHPPVLPANFNSLEPVLEPGGEAARLGSQLRRY